MKKIEKRHENIFEQEKRLKKEAKELVEKGLNGRKWLIENRNYTVLADNYYKLIQSVV